MYMFKANLSGSLKLETTQMSTTGKKVNILCYSHPLEYHAAIKIMNCG